MTENIENWTYKSKAEIEALDDATLVTVNTELAAAIKVFHDMRVPMTDEMFWQLMVIPEEVEKRKLNGANKT